MLINQVINEARQKIKTYSLELIELANKNHNIDQFNELYEEIQKLKELVDAIEIKYGQCS